MTTTTVRAMTATLKRYDFHLEIRDLERADGQLWCHAEVRHQGHVIASTNTYDEPEARAWLNRIWAENGCSRYAPYSDAKLEAEVAKGEGFAPGPCRQARILLEVANEADREALAAEAQTMLNMVGGGRPSDVLRSVVDQFKRTGVVPSRYRDESRRILEAERAIRQQTGRFTLVQPGPGFQGRVNLG